MLVYLLMEGLKRTSTYIDTLPPQLKQAVVLGVGAVLYYFGREHGVTIPPGFGGDTAEALAAVAIVAGPLYLHRLRQRSA